MTDMTPNEDLFFDALIRKDSAFEGIFIVGVKTTGIFCRPTCTARKPRRENVEFFTTPREALLRGYRPCKICHPLEPQGAVPNWLQPLLEEIVPTRTCACAMETCAGAGSIPPACGAGSRSITA